MLCKLLSEVTNRVHKFQATKEPIQQMQVRSGTSHERQQYVCTTDLAQNL